MEFKKLLKKRSSYKVLQKADMDLMSEAYISHEHLEENNGIPNTKEPVWILGKRYFTSKDYEEIRRDINTRLWFTYRKGFSPIGDSGLTSDKGWGCMLRCGQMLLAQALMFLHLGRDWRWTPGCKDQSYLRIVRMFEDRKAATYSIHQIALTGASKGKQVGDWFGPNTISQVVKRLAKFDEWSSMAVHVALDNTIVINDIKKLCTRVARHQLTGGGIGGPHHHGSAARIWKPLLLIVPVRLGLNEINPIYIKPLKTCFTFPQSLGIIGGRPNHALYFIGTVGEDVIFLDPHTTQPVSVTDGSPSSNGGDGRLTSLNYQPSSVLMMMVPNSVTTVKEGGLPLDELEKKVDCSYHCTRASRLHVLHMDPSVAFGFFCRTERDFDDLCTAIKEKIMPEKQAMFEVRDERQSHWVSSSSSACSSSVMGEDVAQALSAYDWDRQFDDSDEEFVLL